MKGMRGSFACMAACAICLFLCAGLACAIDLPDRLKDMPVFPGSKVQQSMNMETGAMATLKVKSQISEVADFYRDNLKSKGWKVIFEAEQENSQVIQFQKDKRTLALSVGADEGDVVYNFIMSEK